MVGMCGYALMLTGYRELAEQEDDKKEIGGYALYYSVYLAIILPNNIKSKRLLAQFAIVISGKLR